jgi:hypothetical protein
MSLEFINKILLIKEKYFPSLKGPRKEASLHVPQKAGPLWKQTPTSRALLDISFSVPSKGDLTSGSPYRAPTERVAPLLKPFLILHSKSPVYEPPSRFPSGVLMERDSRLQNLPLHILQGPQ